VLSFTDIKSTQEGLCSSRIDSAIMTINSEQACDRQSSALSGSILLSPEALRPVVYGLFVSDCNNSHRVVLLRSIQTDKGFIRL